MTLHFGDCGSRIGFEMWDQLGQECNIEQDGTVSEKSSDDQFNYNVFYRQKEESDFFD